MDLVLISKTPPRGEEWIQQKSEWIYFHFSVEAWKQRCQREFIAEVGSLSVPPRMWETELESHYPQKSPMAAGAGHSQLDGFSSAIPLSQRHRMCRSSRHSSHHKAINIYPQLPQPAVRSCHCFIWLIRYLINQWTKQPMMLHLGATTATCASPKPPHG